MRRIIGLLLVCCLFCLGSAVAEPLTALGYDTESVSRNWESNLFFSRMAELTGVEVTGHGIREEKEYLSAINRMLQGEQQADMLFKACLTRDQERSLLKSGAIIDLAPLIEANMPNFSALLTEHPEWKEQIALEDGRIASLPMINLHERQVCAWLNEAWLEKLGVAFPETVDELTEALAAIAARDPNGNGKQDENAVDLIGVYEMRWLLPLFGIVADDYNVCRTDDGTLAFAPDQAAYRTFVETLKTWYDKGLMRRDAFTGSHAAEQLTNAQSGSNDQKKANTSGLVVSVTPYTSVDADAVLDYRAVLIPGPDGRIRWRDLLGEVWTGTFAVTSQCKDPSAALRWVDALYGDAGAALAYVGLEGVDYRFKDSGYWEYILENDNDMEDIRSNRIIYTGSTVPGLYPDRIIENVDSEADRLVFAESEKVHAVSERVLSNYFLPETVAQEAASLSASVGLLVDVGIARFVTGEVPLDDAGWNSWLNSLHEAGSGRLVEILSGL
ncbi:MAG: extracellular solute-binding protein [Clostridia bacterium]|nr:extracellular solute-binding protein [Clostridia bacterium]